MKSIGIDIGHFYIKLVELNVQPKSYSISRMELYPLSQDPTKDRDLEILEILKKIKAQFPTENFSLQTNITGGFLTGHHLHLPFKERFKIKKILAFELEENIPLQMSDTLFDFRITAQHPLGSELIAFAVKKEGVKKSISRFQDVGLEPTIVAPAIMALNNLFENPKSTLSQLEAPPEYHLLNSEVNDEATDENTKPDSATQTPIELGEAHAAEIVIDLGHKESLVLVRSNKKLMEVRKLSWGCHEWAPLFLEAFELTPQSVHNFINTKSGFSLQPRKLSDEQSKPHLLLEKGIQPLLTELKVFILELRSKYALKVRAIGLIGGGALIENIGPFMTQKLGIATNPVDKLSAHPQLKLQEPSGKLMGVAYGLALEGLRGARNPALNFRQDEFALKNKNWESFSEKWGYSLKLASVLLLCLIAYSLARPLLSAELLKQSHLKRSSAANAYAYLNRTQSSPEALEKFLDRQERVLKNYKQTQNFKNPPDGIDFYKALNVKPLPAIDTVELQRYSLNNRTLTLVGLTKNKKALKSLKDKLITISKDSKIKKETYTPNEQSGLTQFFFEILIKGPS